MKKKLKDIAETKFCFLERGNDKEYLLTPANLLEDNQISNIEIDDKFKKDEKVIIRKNDIIIKRINPIYVNLINEVNKKVYAGNNLIIIRAKKVNPKYLAAILNSNIREFSRRNSIGAIIPSIGRKELENFEIESCNKEKQTLIGEYWIKTVEKRILEYKKIELEKQKTNTVINNFLENRRILKWQI